MAPRPGRDRAVADRTFLTRLPSARGADVPDYIQIAESSIPGAGRGAFAAADLPRGAWLGTYAGTRCATPPADDTYTMQIFGTGRRPTFFVDARDTRHWTRFVNCASSRKQANIDAVQRGAEVRFYAKRRVAAGEELLFFYGASLAARFAAPKDPGDQQRLIEN